MDDNITQSPIAAPFVVIDGMRLTLKWTFLAEYEADRMGFDVPGFLTGLKTSNTGKITGFMKMFVAMTAHEFNAVGRPVPDPSYWAAVIDKNPDKFKEICDAVAACLRAKMTPPTVSLRESAATGPELKN